MSAHTTIFKNSHAAVDLSKVKRASDVVGNPGMPTKENFDAVVEYMKIDANFIFYDEDNMLDRFFYWKDFLYVSLYGMQVEALQMFKMSEKIENYIDKMNVLVASGDYLKVFSICDKKILIPTFVNIHQQIPENKRYDVFAHIYARSEFGFGMMSQELYDHVFSVRHLSDKWKERMEEFKALDLGDTFKIYRGQNEESTDADVALSWTLSKDVAKFFANRFKGRGKVLSKIISADQVLDFIDGRGEKEILLAHKK